MTIEPRAMLERLRGLANPGREHVFLGDPRSHGSDKTCVEPGNMYSPGVWSCGISLCIADDKDVYSPLLLDQQAISWRFATARGFAPILEADYELNGIQIVHRLAHRGGEGKNGIDVNEVTLLADSLREVTVGILVRDRGPAGGVIRSLVWEHRSTTLVVDSSLRIVMEDKVDGCEIASADTHYDCPAALIYRTVRLESELPWTFRFRSEHNYHNVVFTRELCRKATHRGHVVRSVLQRSSLLWRRTVPAYVFCPDPRVARAWDCCAYHILAAMECGLPRIGAVNYPIFWMRDGVIILRALDLLGRHDLARRGCDYMAPLIFSGGFGPESDAPGEGIWALVNHARTTGDKTWLKSVFPLIRQRVAYLDKMCTTRRTLHAMTENRTSACINLPDSSVLCLPARKGLIHGRMDHHSPDFYINCWAYAGYAQAAEAAGWIGHRQLTDEWKRRAEKHERALARHLLPRYGNDRDPIVTPWPTRALLSFRERLKEAFIAWFRAHRIAAEGTRRPETEWTYFETAQIHNAILLGFVGEAWVCLDGMLAQEPQRDVFAFVEGPPGGNEALPFRNDIGKRGWLDPQVAHGGNMPHNWTSAEMIALIRDIFLCEDNDGLILGAGVPESWRQPGAEFGVEHFPTVYGTVSFRARFDKRGVPQMVKYRGPRKWQWAESLNRV